jgi:hypothetical protein
MSTELEWPCLLKTLISGSLARLEASNLTYLETYPYRRGILEQICNCARIDANCVENPDGSTTVTLVNGKTPAIMLKTRLSMIGNILRRALIRSSREKIEEVAKKLELRMAITWRIYDFSGEYPGREICLFIYYRISQSLLDLTERWDNAYLFRKLGEFERELHPPADL